MTNNSPLDRLRSLQGKQKSGAKTTQTNPQSDAFQRTKTFFREIFFDTKKSSQRSPLAARVLKLLPKSQTSFSLTVMLLTMGTLGSSLFMYEVLGMKFEQREEKMKHEAEREHKGGGIFERAMEVDVEKEMESMLQKYPPKEEFDYRALPGKGPKQREESIFSKSRPVHVSLGGSEEGDEQSGSVREVPVISLPGLDMDDEFDEFDQ